MERYEATEKIKKEDAGDIINRIDELISEADSFLEVSDFIRAEEILIFLHGNFPDFADICNRLGHLYHQKGDYVRAREFLERAIQLNPDYTEASLNLAVTLNEMGQYSKAQLVVDNVQNRVSAKEESIDPFVAGKIANKHKELGDIYREFFMLNEAASEYRKALSLSPGFADIQVKLGITLRELGFVDEALELFSNTATKRPDYADARIQLGITFFSQGFIDRAIAEWGKVLELNPENRKARMYLSFMKSNESG